MGPLNWVVYIVRCTDGTLYTGITNDLERRMAQHEAGKGAKYTKGRGPLQLVYHEMCQNRGVASKREVQIKSLDRKAKFLLVSTIRSGNSERDGQVGQVNL
jgi:putative endonuclease